MSESERPEPSRARSTQVAHIGVATPAMAAAYLTPLVARVARDMDRVQVLVLVPTPGDAVALTRELRALADDPTLRLAPLSSPRRARRLMASAVPHVAVGTAAVLTELLRGSVLPAEPVAGVAIVEAAELEAEGAAVEVLLAEVGKGAAKVLTTTIMTPFVEQLLEGHLHGARRLHHAAEVVAPPTSPPPVEVVVTAGAVIAQVLADVLERVDAPSAAIVPCDPRREAIVRDALHELGYPEGSPLARVVTDGATAGAALVCCVGAPRAGQWVAITAAEPARIVAITTLRERATLDMLPGARTVPFASAAPTEAAAAEGAVRARISQVLHAGLPAREMLALEPLLGEHDPLAVAGALLRLLDRERERSVRPTANSRTPIAAAPAAPAARGRDDRPPRSRDDRGGPPRGRDGDRRGPPRGRDGERRGPPRGRDGERRGPPRDRDGERRGPPRGRDGERSSGPPRSFRKPE